MQRWILIFAFTAACGGRHHTDSALPEPPQPISTGNPGPRTTATVVPELARPEVIHADPPPSAPEEEPKIPRSLEVVINETNARLEDAFFAYDRADLSDDALNALRRDADLLAPMLAEFPAVKAVVEGHCDERGSAEYNLALGDSRASRAADLLRQFGVARDRVVVISYGKEAPQCTESNEGCWQKNRRAHLAVHISR